MPYDNSQNPDNDLIVRMGLIREVESGVLDSIECPHCHRHSVSVWFTHPKWNEYRTWFRCRDCSFEMRVQNSERPQHYCAERIDEALEAYDSDLLEKKHFDFGVSAQAGGDS